MGGKTVMIVPGSVPGAIVQRLLRREPERPPIGTADPYPVPVAHPVRLVADAITPEQVAQLRAENADLRSELARVRAT